MPSSNIDNQKDYWNSVAGQKNFTHPLDLALFSKYIGKECRVIDYGCGYGRLTAFLVEAGYENVTGYDTSVELINRGKKLSGAPLQHIDEPGSLPVENNSVDCILLFAVLTCIPSNSGQTALINILHSKLKTGGVLYISDYYIQEDTEEVNRYNYLNGDKDNFGTFTLSEGVTFRHHTKEWIDGLLAEFAIKENKKIDVYTMNGHAAKAFQIIAEKPFSKVAF